MISNDKILGVFVDDNLTWSHHIKHLSKKISSSIWLLSKIKKFLTKDHRVQFYKSYIQPHIDFCNIVWGSSSESNKLKIFKLQKRACKVILYFNVNDINEAMKSLKIMSIYERLYLRKAKFISSNSRQYYIMLPSIPQNDADLITSRDEPPIRTQTCNPV